MSYYDTKRSNKEIVKKKKVGVCVCNIYEVYEKYMYHTGRYIMHIFYERINLYDMLI